MLGDTMSPAQLIRLVGGRDAPVLLDVRRQAVFSAARFVLPAARHGDAVNPSASLVGLVGPVVCYCAHGHNVGQMAAAQLRAQGIGAAWLEGGIEAYEAAGGPLVARLPDAAKRFGEGTVWVTRRRPKIDRLACPWLIRRFVDARARFLFVEKDYVLPIAEEIGGIAFDVEGAPVTHERKNCSFDALLTRYDITDPAMLKLADIVRGADTGDLSSTQEAGGLLALSLGLSQIEADDHAQLEQGFLFYDALYAYLRFALAETHSWPPRT